MKSTLGLDNVAKKVSSVISRDLDRAGLMYRLFYRVKSQDSIEKKITAKEYRKLGKKVTDLIGIRVTLYFQDDVGIVYEHLKSMNNFNHESTDTLEVDKFEPTRCNLTFDFQDEFKQEVLSILANDSDVIDTTYEVQLRTVLSEGWHEVEHDLRYKCKEDWDGHNDLNRNLNGIFATLETSEFSMLRLFNELSHRHYKDSNIEGLLKTQFRLRFTGESATPEMLEYINSNKDVLKSIHRIDRKKLIECIMKSKYALPISIDNLIHVCNHLFLKHSELTGFMEGNFLANEIELAFKKEEEEVVA